MLMCPLPHRRPWREEQLVSGPSLDGTSRIHSPLTPLCLIEPLFSSAACGLHWLLPVSSQFHIINGRLQIRVSFLNGSAKDVSKILLWLAMAV